MFELSLLVLVAWGALAFGAEYAWAYAPLMVLCLVTGILGLRNTAGAPPSRLLLSSIAAIFLGGLAQVTLPADTISGQGLATQSVDFERLYALVTMQPAPPDGPSRRLSIAPERTKLGLAFLTALGILLVGCTRGISAVGPRNVTRGLLAIGVVVALVGIVQSTTRTEALYGFWRIPRYGQGFAPFVNENHFAGWMAMVLALTVGAFAGDLSSAMRRVHPDWRERFLWLSSRRASVMMLSASAGCLMALSMVITLSRGGLVGLAGVTVIGSWWMLRRQSGLRRLAAAMSVGTLVIVALTWGGAERTVAQFSGITDTLGNRKQIWFDTLKVVQDRPFTGSGLNTHGVAMLHYQTAPISTGAVTEAHNDYLQLAAEGGLLLGIPILLALAVFIREIWRRFKEAADDAETYWQRAGAVTGLLTIAGMETFDFTLQMPGAAATFVVLAAIAIHRPNHLHRFQRSARQEAGVP